MRSEFGSHDIDHCASLRERFAWLGQFGLLEPVSWEARRAICLSATPIALSPPHLDEKNPIAQ
jgi:hypothetical protein